MFQLGGWAMWPLLLFSIVTMSIIIERFIYFLLHNLKVEHVKKNVLEKIREGKVSEALDYCSSCPKKLLSAHIFSAGLRVLTLGEHRMEKAMETEASEKINALEGGFNLLLAIGSIAPITGFLGTVSGMIGAFSSIAKADEVNAQLVAGGIFEALITTAYGLSIAIVAVSAYYILIHIVDRFSARVEEGGSEIVTALLMDDYVNGAERQ